jgi:4-hydroxy-tetrahydrodipicolinate synthase
MLEGVNTRLATPHSSGTCPDLDGLRRLIDFVTSRGVKAICIGSTTGEFVHFSLSDRCRLVTVAVRHSPAPVVAGIGHSTLDGALELARGAADSGAQALLVMPPYFYRYFQEEVREFFLRFADAAPEGLPVLLYNIPAFTNEISGETTRELLSSGRFAGIKDSSGSLEAFLRLKAIRSHRPFTLLVGDDKIFTEARTQGADGVVSGVASVLPELLLAIEHAIQMGASTRAQALDRRLREFLAWIERFPVPFGIKMAVAERGLSAGPDPIPLSPGRRKLAGEFKSWFQQWLPVVLEEAA